LTEAKKPDTSPAAKPTPKDAEASKPDPKPETQAQGSPQPFKADENPGKGGVEATKGNESPNTVASQTTDNSPATPPGDHANVAGATQDPKNAAVVGSEDVGGKKGEIESKPSGDYLGNDPKPGDGVAQKQEAASQAERAAELKGVDAQTADAGIRSASSIADAEFERARNEPESPLPSDEALDALDGLSAGVAQSGEMLQDQQEADRVMKKLTNLALDLLPTSSPDSYTLFGYGGVHVTVGDLRVLGRILRKHQKD